jgi:TfoX-like protein
MAYDERLANRIRKVFESRSDIVERKMFGGLAFLCRGRMCCGIVGSDLMVRIPADEIETAMRRRYVRPMDFTGKPLRGLAYVAPPGIRTAAGLRAWLARGERVAEQKAAAGRPLSRRSTHRGRRAAPDRR